jgi:hypothetical protein
MGAPLSCKCFDAMRLFNSLFNTQGAITPYSPPGYNPHTDAIIRDAIPVQVILLWGYESWYSAYWGDALYIAERLFVSPHVVNGVHTLAYRRDEIWGNGMDGARRLQRAVGRQIVLVQ